MRRVTSESLEKVHTPIFLSNGNVQYRQKRYFRKSEERGITLVALVVTIVVLLILAGITIATLFGDNGIIKKAQKAKDEQLRANEQERLELVKMEVAAKNDGKVDIDDYIQEVIDKGITDKVEDKEDGSKEFETDTGFDVTVKPNPDNKNDVIIIIGGGGGNSSGGDKTKAPTIKEIEVTSGVDNVKVDVKTENTDGATYKYYYKTDADEEYTLAHEGKEPSYTIRPLAQDTKYTIKVEVTNKNGTATDEAIARTGEIPSAVGAITFTNSTWVSGKQSVTVTKTTTDNYKIEYQIMDENGNEKIDYTEIASGERISNLSHGDIVVARLTDGQNKGNTATYNVRDNTPPTVTVTKGTVTSNSIQVNVNATDNESGMPASPIYKYYIKKSSETNYPTNSHTSNTFTDLEANTSYDVKVEVEDNAGNKGMGELNGISTIPAKDAEWTQNPDGTISDGNGTTLKIGDYVDYDCTTSNATYTSLREQNGYNNQVFNANEYQYGWRVLGVNNNKQLLLISEDFAQPSSGGNVILSRQTYGLRRKSGYLNGIDELNNICDIYGKGNGATGARSLTIEDVDRITGYNPNNEGVRDPERTGKGTKSGEGHLSEYGNSVEYTLLSNGVKYTSKGNNAAGGTSSIYERFAYFNESNTWQYLKINEKVTLRNDVYSYYPTTLTGTKDNTVTVGIGVNTPEYKMLFTNSSTGAGSEYKWQEPGVEYWLASSCNFCQAGTTSYEFFTIESGRISFHTLIDSNDGATAAREYRGVRPVVSLNNKVKLTYSETQKDGCNLYNMSIN